MQQLNKELNVVKLSRKQFSAALELVIVLLATALVFCLGVAAAKAERGYGAHGGKYVLLVHPVLYYAKRQSLQDWLVDFREIRRGGQPWKKED